MAEPAAEAQVHAGQQEPATEPEVRIGPWAPVLPAVLAGIAEAGPIFLLAELAARSTVLHPNGGPLAWYPLFLVLFAGGVAVGTRLRDSSKMPATVAACCFAIGVVQAIVWNDDGGGGAFVAIAVCLACGVRIATLSLRDWRDPIDSSFGWGAGLLLGEIAFTRVAGWGDVVWPVAILFFLGSLGSRTASVRLVERSIGGAAAGPDSSRRWRLVGIGLVGGAATVTGIGLLLGTQKGPIDKLAEWLVAALGWLVYGAAVVVASVISFILGIIGVDRSRLDESLQGLKDALDSLATRPDQAGAPLWQRAVGIGVIFLVLAGLTYIGLKKRWPVAAVRFAVIFGFFGLVHVALNQQGTGGVAVVVLIVGLTYFVLRRRAGRRKAAEQQWGWVNPERDEGLRLQFAEARKRRKQRHELPEDTVRRLYAQALVELEGRGRPRPASVTPGEFLRTIRRDLPECAAGMGVLTRAYEDVRYGRIVLDQATVGSLEAEFTVLRRSIRAASLPEAEAERDETDSEALATHMAERAEGAAGAAPSSDDTFGRR
jgi:hypothetical protein